METIEAYQLGRAGAGISEEIGYNRGYAQGVEDTIQRVSKFIDEETLDYIKEELLEVRNENKSQ